MPMLPDTAIEDIYALVAAVYRLAVRDAGRGNREAIRFLNICCPDWREQVAKYKHEARSSTLNHN